MNEMSVKQERHDEAEIRELALKFTEANKAKMANPQRTPQTPGQSMNILSFLTSDKNKAKTTAPVTENDTKNIDEESVKGRFGWALMGKIHIPYIMRSGEHYCAVRMVEMKVLNKLLNYLNQDLYNCTNIRSYYITEAEARLLNEINFKHCDYQFGRDQFTSRDLIVRLTDANEFYKFLAHCYSKLVNGNDGESLERCGFIRINRESVVPFTVYNEQKYVPLFYFEGETDNLKLRADKLEGWDLSYLKFCCKVQGIRNELFAHDSCSVISLNDIKNYFPPGTLFEDYWPKKNLDSQLLISGTTNPQPIVQWTRQPIAPPITAHPPPSPKPAAQAKATGNNSHMHNMHVFGNFNLGNQPAYHNAQARTGGGPIRATYPAASRHLRPPYYSGITNPPPPLVRSNSAGMAQYNAQTKAPGNYMMMDHMNQNNFHQGSSQQQANFPPPLMHMNGGRYEGREMQNTFNAVSTPPSLVNPQPAHQASRTQTTTPSEDRTLLTTNGRPLISRSKLSNAPVDTSAQSQNNTIPYKLQKILVEGKLIPCINMKPNSYTDMLVTLPDLVNNFFSNIPAQSCQQVLQVLGIEVYKANTSQMRVLVENGKAPSEHDNMALVQVRNVIDYMPQLKYMLSGLVSSEAGSKRQRNS